jgi:alpha-amylase/alpha-mannosidase (GH57 family)
VAARLIVHGHFYQPPRADPWSGAIEAQSSAAPFHDWNERVHAECYRPNVNAQIVTDEGEQVANNLDHMSFNFGPTLMSWLEQVHPSTYERILEADRTSRDRLGHGNAIAQAFHHTILPLSPVRDVRTQVRWGLADFEFRFGRAAEGLWLPETAVDDDVLIVLIEEGLGFTILAPHQARRWREPGGDWNDVTEAGIDTTRPYVYFHPDGSGRSIALCFYDGPRSRAIAFENVTSSAERFLDHLSGPPDESAVVSIATDGETYGHHHEFADICLAYAFNVEAPRREVEFTNYAAWLAEQPPALEVQIDQGGTSWSCLHGVGRWIEDCGCSTGGEGGWAEGWNQAWRGPLRRGLELLRDAADEVFEREGSRLFADPWEARDRYVEVRLGARGLDDFLAAECSIPVDEDVRVRAWRLLTMQEMALSMFTSCGWFFSDVGGIETIQILRYAARTLDLLAELGATGTEDQFMMVLEEAKSNDVSKGTAADIFNTRVRTRRD